MTSPAKAVLFDLDETLFDHQHSVRTAKRTVHAMYACFAPHTFDRFEADLEVRLQELWPEVMNGRMSIPERLGESFRRLCDQYSLAEVDSGSMAGHYLDAYLRSRQVIPGAIPLLEAVRPHAKIGIVTNHLPAVQAEKLQILKLDGLVDFVVCSGELGIHKPDRRIFEYALEKAGCTPVEAVMIGDSWHADIEGAAGVGIRAVWFNQHGHAAPDAKLAAVITSLEPADHVAGILLGTP
jgi:YjjG family noncanonical pyrimidine nucleotidase